MNGHGGRRPGAGRPRRGKVLSDAGYGTAVVGALVDELLPLWLRAAGRILADPRRKGHVALVERLAGLYGDIGVARMRPPEAQLSLPFGGGVDTRFQEVLDRAAAVEGGTPTEH